MIETIKNNTNVKWTTHLFLFICFAFFAIFAVWAYYGKLDIISLTSGRVVPSSKVKQIQHLEGGIVSEILVEEGEIVTEDQPLIVLEGVRNASSARELEVRIAAYDVDIIRLQAMIAGDKKPKFPEPIATNFGDLVKQAGELYDVHMLKFRSDLTSQRQFIEQRTQDINGVNSRISNNQIVLGLLGKQIAISEELLKDQLTTEYKHLGFLREKVGVTSKIEEDQSMLKRSESQLEEAKEKLRRIQHTFREVASDELKDARLGKDEFVQRLKKYKDGQRRTVIRSPVNGVVKTMYVYTVGGVVAPGRTIVDIVPTGDTLLIEAHLSIQDIGHISVGQESDVKLVAQMDARRFGKIRGEVMTISPDAVVAQDGQTFYIAMVKPDKNYFESGPDKYNLIPGMVVSVAIRTGRRTVLEYILDPFIVSMGYSLQER